VAAAAEGRGGRGLMPSAGWTLLFTQHDVIVEKPGASSAAGKARESGGECTTTGCSDSD